MKKILIFLFLLPTLALVAEYKAQDFSYILGMKGFTDEALEMHFKLYQGYVKNTNLLLELIQNLEQEGRGRSPEYAGLKKMFGFEFDGMRLHEFYFGNLGGDGEVDKGSPLYKQIEKDFGSYESWKKGFIDTGLLRGIGWSILYRDPKTGRLINAWVEEHQIGNLVGGDPILVMDVWEHAYITMYGLDRAKYIDVFFANIDWDEVDKRFSKMASVSPMKERNRDGS